MSTPANGNSPQPVTSDSFRFNSNPFLLSKTARPKSSMVRQRRPKSRLHQRITGEQQQQQQLENVPLDNSIPALDGIVIYIDKSVMNRNSLTGMANALAATVLDRWATSATHLIHGPIVHHPYQQRQQNSQQNGSTKRNQGQRTPPIITKSLEKKMRVVSPTWLADCYNNKERMPESFYPYEMNSHHRMKSLRHTPSMDSLGDENPFNLEPDEFATVESFDDELENGDPVANNRRVTDYFRPTNNSRSEPDIARNNQHDDLDGGTHHLEFNNDDDILNRGDDGNLQNTINKDSMNGSDNVDAADISYSLIEMSQVQVEQLQQSNDIPHMPLAPPQQQPQQQRQQQPKMEPLKPSVTASVERSIQQMITMDGGSQASAHDHSTALASDMKMDDGYDNYGDYDVDDSAASFSVLPDLDPNRQPKVTLGREDRLQIWYGEQSFCLDAGLPLSRKRDECVDSTSRSIPPQVNGKPTSTTKASTPSNVTLATSKSPTTIKRFKKSHQ